MMIGEGTSIPIAFGLEIVFILMALTFGVIVMNEQPTPLQTHRHMRSAMWAEAIRNLVGFLFDAYRRTTRELGDLAVWTSTLGVLSLLKSLFARDLPRHS